VKKGGAAIETPVAIGEGRLLSSEKGTCRPSFGQGEHQGEGGGLLGGYVADLEKGETAFFWGKNEGKGGTGGKEKPQ